MRIVAHSPVPQRAQAVAATVADRLIAQLSDNGVVTLSLFDEARVPDSPVAPQPKLIIAASIIVGLAFGVGGAVAWDRLFGRINDPRELADATGVPVLGVLPEERTLRSGVRLVVGRSELARSEEAFRALQTNLMFVMGEGQARAAAVTSLNPGE